MEERVLLATDLLSINASGTAAGNDQSSFSITNPVLTPDGRYAAFFSLATDLTATPDTNGAYDVFVRDVILGTTTLVSVNATGNAAGNGQSSDFADLGISDDGRFVVFLSDATDLTTTPDNNLARDVFVRDLSLGTTTLVSVNATGTASAGGGSLQPFITPDGRSVAFVSDAPDLTTTFDNNLTRDVFVRDLSLGTTTLVSVAAAGTAAGNGQSERTDITPDGRYVAFSSEASDLTTIPDNNGNFDVFVRDLILGTTTLVSRNVAGTAAGGGQSFSVDITPDGRSVAFVSDAPDLSATRDNNLVRDVFVRDLIQGTTTLVTINAAGTAAGSGSAPNATGFSPNASVALTPDGRFVVFSSVSTDLTSLPDTNGALDVFVRDLSLAKTTLISRNATGTAAGNDFSFSLDISPDGQFVLFDSSSDDLTTTPDDNGDQDVFVHNLTLGTTVLISRNAAGTAAGNGSSSEPAFVLNATVVAFLSFATDLTTTPDGNGVFDVFIFRNTPPTASDDVFTAESTGRFVSSPGVLANDTDVEGHPLLALRVVVGPANGTVRLNRDGSFTYTPNSGFEGVDSFTYEASDGISPSNIATSVITVTGDNDPPVLLVPGPQAASEDVPLTFSAATSNALGITDPDAGVNPVQVTLEVGNGILTLATMADLSFSEGDGFQDARITFTGTLAAINAALNGLVYTPGANFNGADTMTVTTNDQGNTGSGGPLVAVDTVAITVGAVNDAPTVIRTIPNVEVGQGSPAVTRSLSGVFADVDIATNGDRLSLDASSSNPGLVEARLVGETLTLRFVQGQTGVATIVVRATDRANAFVEVAFDVVVTSDVVDNPPVVDNPTIPGTGGRRTDDDLFVIDLDPADSNFLRVRRNDDDPILVSLIVQPGVNIDGGLGDDRFVINLAGLPNLSRSRPFTLIVSGGVGDDRVNLLGLPAVAGIDLVLDGETADPTAPSAGGNSGDLLDFSRLPTSARIVAYSDPRRDGAIGLEFRDGASVTGLSLRNFGSTTGLASDSSVELVGDNGVGTVFGSGEARPDRISVRATGFREFAAVLNGSTPLRFTAPRLAIRGKLRSDTFEITPLAANAWGVSVEVEGSDRGDFSAVGAVPGAGDILTLIDLDPQSNEISVSDGGIPSGFEGGLSFLRIDTIGVRPSEAAGSIPNTLRLTDSTPGRTLKVDLGASGVVAGSTYEPIVVLTGPGVEARHGVALATETGEDDILLDLKGGGHVVNVNVSHTRGNTGRNVAIQGDRTDVLNITVEGNPRVRRFVRVVRFSNPSVRRRFTIIRVRYTGRGGATYQITATNVVLNMAGQGPRMAVGGRAEGPLLGERTPAGPLSIAGLTNRPMTRRTPSGGPGMTS